MESVDLSAHIYLEALSTIVGAKLKYLSLVKKDDSDWYVCLGEHNMYFIEEDLTEYFDPIPYDSVIGINISENQKGVLQVLTKKDKSRRKDSIVIITDSPKEFLKCFQLYWQTDKMFRFNKFEVFSVNKIKVIKR